MDKKPNNLAIKVANSIFSLALLVSLVLIMFSGYKLVAATMLVLAVAGAASPVISAGGTLFEVVTEVISTLVAGVQALIEAVTSMIGSLFGG